MTHCSITLPDGLTMTYRDHAPAGAPVGAPVVCMHGLTRNAEDFREVAAFLTGLGRRVIAPTVRGRGRSSYDPDPSRYQPLTYAQDVLGLLAALGVDRAVAIGTSMGGLMATLMAALKPGLWQGVILNDVGPELAPEGLARIAGYVGLAGPFDGWPHAEAACRSIGATAFPDADEAFWADFARRTCVATPDGGVRFDYDPAIANAFRTADGAAPTIDLWPMFAALAACPVLVVRGALSDILVPETVAKMQAAHPRLTAVDVPRVGHAPMLDEPAAWGAVSRFISGL